MSGVTTTDVKVAVIEKDQFYDSSQDMATFDLTLARRYITAILFDSTFQTSTTPNNGSIHGPMVTSILSSPKNSGTGSNWCGVKPDQKLIPIIVGSNSLSLAAAIRYAYIQGVKVINISMGLASGMTLESDSDIGKAMLEAYYNHCTVVFTAGNMGVESHRGLASYTGGICVGGLDKNTGMEAYFDAYNATGHGTRIDVSAAAVSVPASGDKAYPTWQTTSSGGPVWGTSYAAPIVSGLVAYLYSIEPNLQVDDIRAILYASSDVVRTNDTRKWRLGIDMDNSFANYFEPATYPAVYGARSVDFQNAIRMLKQAKVGYSVRAFNSNDDVKVKIPSGSWTSPTTYTRIYQDLASGLTGAVPAYVEFQSVNPSGNRTSGAAVLYKISSGRYRAAVKTRGIVRRYTPDEERLFSDLTVTPNSANPTETYVLNLPL